jgi:hypothetical protein
VPSVEGRARSWISNSPKVVAGLPACFLIGCNSGGGVLRETMKGRPLIVASRIAPKIPVMFVTHSAK